jgi:tetratricopeptide (TPR) repeat protein
MGKKSKRKKKNRGPLRNDLAAASTTATIYETICPLLDARNFDEIFKIESKYRHLDTFSNNPHEEKKKHEEIVVLFAFGGANMEHSKDDCSIRAIEYFERAKEHVDANNGDQRHKQSSYKSSIEMNLATLYSDGRGMEKAISSHRLSLANCNHDVVTADYLIHLSNNFNRFDRFEYTIEVLEGFMDMMETVEEKNVLTECLICAYIGCGDFLNANAAHKKCRSRDIHDRTAGIQSGAIEEGLCNYKAAIVYFRKGVAELQEEEYEEYDNSCSVGLARTLLKDSAANESEAFAIFQEELDECVDPLDTEEILLQIGTWYRKLHKWEQSIESLHQLSCLSSTRPHGTMLSQANEATAQTYLEQYCTVTTLDIDQRTEILCNATNHSNKVDEVSTERHLTQAQLFYFNGDKQQAYNHLELYLDARLAECKITCYTCNQRVRHGSVPFSCASCRVASYCGRKHQKMTWKNERVCHKVLCPLLGYWRLVKKKRKKHKGLMKEDRRVFETFFESICPHA